mgnify:CR=1 FL=1
MRGVARTYLNPNNAAITSLSGALLCYLMDKNCEVRLMVEFTAGLITGAAFVTVILGAHFVKLTGELREQIAKLQIERNSDTDRR